MISMLCRNSHFVEYYYSVDNYKCSSAYVGVLWGYCIEYDSDSDSDSDSDTRIYYIIDIVNT